MPKAKIKRKNSLSVIKKVLLKGPILTNSGYGVHTRQIFEALKCTKNIDLYVQPTQWGNTSWLLTDCISDANVTEIASYCRKVNNSKLFDVSYQVLVPNEWEDLAKKNVGITAGFEADVVKRKWISHCNVMDLVIVPSNFSKSAFLKTSRLSNIKLETKIEVVNEWYYKSFDKVDSDLDFLDSLKKEKNILIIGQITSNSEISDRKNMLKTIRCVYDFIREKNDIGLVLKINIGRYSNASFVSIKKRIEALLGKIENNKVCLVFGSLNIEELKGLYEHKKISCLVSGTRAEGWGLPFIEAASCGLPIVATNYSAYKEFLEDDFIKIDFDKEIFNYDSDYTDVDAKPYWANFKEESMIACLDRFFKNKVLYDEIAIRRKNIIKQTLDYDTIVENYKEIFESNF